MANWTKSRWAINGVTASLTKQLPDLDCSISCWQIKDSLMICCFSVVYDVVLVCNGAMLQTTAVSQRYGLKQRTHCCWKEHSTFGLFEHLKKLNILNKIALLFKWVYCWYDFHGCAFLILLLPKHCAFETILSEKSQNGGFFCIFANTFLFIRTSLFGQAFVLKF